MRITLLVLLFFAAEAHAGLFKIINRNYGSAGAYQSEIDPVFNALEDQMNAVLPATDNASFMTSMGNNAVMSGAANAANYGSAIRVFEAGIHGGLSVQSANTPSGSITLNNVGGFGAQATLRVGTYLGLYGDNWGFLDLKRAWLYLGILTYDYTKDETSFRFGATTLYLQYQLYEPAAIGWGSLKWNGLNIGTGLRYVSMKANAVQSVTKTESQVMDTMPGTPTVTATYNGSMTVGAEVQAFAIPIEVSTSARVLWGLTSFIGLGVDIAMGKAKSIANLSGPVNITESSGSYGSFSGDSVLDLGDEGSPRTAGGRFFTGLQIEVGVASLTFSTTKSIPEKDTAFNAGLRIYW